MSCNCNSSEIITSWIDWADTMPKSPLDLIANARLGSAQGVFAYSTTFSSPSGSTLPSASPIALSSDPICFALGTDNLQNVADAAQWNFAHQTRNSSTKLAPPLSKVIFLRAGTQWEMKIPLSLGPGTYVNFELSYRDNAGTRGDAQGTVPVISFSGTSFTDPLVLYVTLKQVGHVSMGLRAIDNAGNWSMYESEWIIVP